jgi:SnoaL-like polyketide cyclase
MEIHEHHSLTAWDGLPAVVSPRGVILQDILVSGEQRQAMPGFEPVYLDFVDYIVRCTHRIWEERDVGLCRTHYDADVVMHTLAGPASGAEAVVQGTISALAASSDRQVIGEDVIWSHDPDGRLYSSHRITSQMTHMGDDAMLGPATFLPIGATTIADCAVVENRIVEEWLVRDNCRAVLQVGKNPWAAAQEFAMADQRDDQQRHGWRNAAIRALRSNSDCLVPDEHPAAPIVAMLRLAFLQDMLGEAAQSLSNTIEIRWPTQRIGYGRGYWIGCITQLRAMLHDCAFAVQHVAARPNLDGSVAVAIRWSLAGHHRGLGPWGPPSGREILVIGVSHYRVEQDLVTEDVTVFDELAVLRQIAGGLGA